MVRPHPKVVRVLLLIVIPVMAVLVGGVLWLRGGGSVGTEDAYVKNDIAQIAPEIAGRVAEVMVRDHAQIGAGDVLVKLDAEPFRLALAKAEAELDAARTTVVRWCAKSSPSATAPRSSCGARRSPRRSAA